MFFQRQKKSASTSVDSFPMDPIKGDVKIAQESVSPGLKGEELFSRTGSSFGAYFNIICVVAGSGTLGIPYAFREGGWISLFFLFLSAVISIYTGRLLMECLYYKPGERLHSYPEIGEAAFGPIGKIVVQVFHYSTLLGVSCLYLVLIGSNMDLIDKQVELIGFSPGVWVSIGAAVITIPFLLLRTLKEVAWLSSLGALATLVVVIVTVVVGLSNFTKMANTDIINWKTLPSSVATLSFSFGGNIVYPHVESSMRSPKQWTKVLSASMATIASMYGLIGVVGYMVYGDKVESPIMKSLPPGAGALIATSVITLHILLVIPITLCSFSLEVERKLKISSYSEHRLFQFAARLLVRLSTLVILTLIAAFTNHFPELMSLIGALSNCATVFVIPIVCHLRLYGWRNRPFFEIPWIILIMILAFMGCILGSMQAVKDLVTAMSKKS